jgi:hypothetical protein
MRTVVGGLLALSVAVSSCTGSPDRRVMAELIAAEMYANLERVVETSVVPRDEDPSSAARGEPDGYRRAVVLRDSEVRCSRPDTVACGAKVEVFGSVRRAEVRSQVLQARRPDGLRHGERVYRRGAVILRTSEELDSADAHEYEQAFDRALSAFTDRLADKADLRQAG